MKKIFILLFLLPTILFAQNRGVKMGEYRHVDSLKVGDSVLKQSTFVRIGTGGGGGITALSQASDVNISSPSNKQLLQYQTGDNKWHNYTLIAGDIPDLSATYQTVANLSTNTSLGTSNTLYPSQNAVKVYVDNTAASIVPKAANDYATTAALAANTYNNGTSGVGATITMDATGTVTIDGHVTALNENILIKDESTAANNGIYTVTTAGAVGVAGVFTRRTDFDQSSEMVAGAETFIINGTANAGKKFSLSAAVTTVGTTAANFVQTGGASGVAWGAITGTLSDQTDLNSALGGKQASDATLTALAAYNTNGILVQTSADNFAGRTITGTSGKIAITNGDGVSANPNINIGSDIIDKTQINTFNAGAKQIFQADATYADIRLTGTTGSDPGTLSDGDIWYRFDNDEMKYRANGTTRIFVNTDESQTLTNKTINFSNNSVSATLAQLNTTISDANVASIDGTETLTNKRVTKRTGTVASSATPTINTDNVDFYSITALAANITSFTTNLSGTPTEAQFLWIAITDNGTARTISWGASFEASTVPLPTTTVISTRLDVGFVWNAATSKWRCVASQGFEWFWILITLIFGAVATKIETKVIQMRQRRMAA